MEGSNWPSSPHPPWSAEYLLHRETRRLKAPGGCDFTSSHEAADLRVTVATDLHVTVATDLPVTVTSAELTPLPKPVLPPACTGVATPSSPLLCL